MVVAASEAKADKSRRTLVVELPLRARDTSAFSRADLVFRGVDHSGVSYEVRLFLNNAKADVSTPRSAEEGYAGRFSVFGHGGCYGDDGHCNIPPASADPTDLALPHPLTPLNTYVTVTEALRRLLNAGEDLHTVTLVPVSITPRRTDRRPAPELLHFSEVELHTYAPATEPAEAGST